MHLKIRCDEESTVLLQKNFGTKLGPDRVSEASTNVEQTRMITPMFSQATRISSI
jgi:hypothetical protein